MNQETSRISQELYDDCHEVSLAVVGEITSGEIADKAHAITKALCNLVLKYTAAEIDPTP